MRDQEKTIGNIADKANMTLIGYIDDEGFPVTKAMLKPRERNGIREFWFSTNTSSNKVGCFKKNSKASIYHGKMLNSEFTEVIMKKGIILYTSKYGATKKYTNWLMEETGFDCMQTKTADLGKISKYDVIILGGGIYASGIAGLSFLKKNYSAIKDRKIIVFCVGASPYEELDFEQIVEHNLRGDMKEVKCFYCRGAWDEESMSFKDKTLCKMLQKAVSKKDPSTYEVWEKALMCAVGQKCDWTDKQYLIPIIKFIEN